MKSDSIKGSGFKVQGLRFKNITPSSGESMGNASLATLHI